MGAGPGLGIYVITGVPPSAWCGGKPRLGGGLMDRTSSDVSLRPDLGSPALRQPDLDRANHRTQRGKKDAIATGGGMEGERD